MDFGWSDAQRDLYQTTLAFARGFTGSAVGGAPAAGAAGQDKPAWPGDEWRRAGEFGLLGLSLPERYRGLGLDALTTALAVEAFGRGCRDAGLVFSASAHLFA